MSEFEKLLKRVGWTEETCCSKLGLKIETLRAWDREVGRFDTRGELYNVTIRHLKLIARLMGL